MTRRFRSWIVRALVASVLASLCAATLTATAAVAGTGQPAQHTRTGRVINVLVGGDSYAAGNGSDGATYNVSPDDPSTPPAPYQGPGCWRKYDNASMLAYNRLGSTGTYINRACSGKLTTDVTSEVADLHGTATGNAVDLIVYSAGGNDVHFADVAQHCILAGGIDLSSMTVNGRQISRNCYNLLAAMKGQIDNVIADEQGNLQVLLSWFPNAHIVVDGYPMLTSKVASSGAGDVQANTINYTYNQLASLLPQIASKQAAMVAGLGSRVAFNNVFARFGGVANNHGVHSSVPWLYGLRPNTDVMESLHPNPTGQSQIANGIVAAVNAAGWFSGYPTASGKPVPTFTFIPHNGVVNNSFQLMDGSGTVYNTTTVAGQLLSCDQQTLTISGWVGAARHVLELSSTGPDTIRVVCADPRPGDIVSNGSASYLAGGSGAAFTLSSIPTGWMYNCLAAASGVRKYTISNALTTLKGVSGTVPGQSSCVPSSWRNRVLVGPNDASYFVDSGGVRHWVQSTQTFYALTQEYGPAIRLDQQVDVNTIPEGAWQPEQLYVPTHRNTIIRRSDGVSWIVDANGWRHHIPTYADDVCARWVWQYPVSETGLSYNLANSLPEGDPWTCDNYIVAANEGASYFVTGHVRHWIQDGMSFWAYADMGYPVVRGISQAEINPIPEGSWMPLRLDPRLIDNHVVRVSDGTAYFVDAGGTWHWIPNGGIWGCITAVHSVAIYNATWTEVNQFRREGAWAVCGM